MTKLENIIFETLIDLSLSTDEKGGSLAEYFTDLLECFVDEDDCSFDHHGGCQAHGYLWLKPGEKCPQQELKELLK